LATTSSSGSNSSRRSVSSLILSLAACMALADGQRARKRAPGLLKLSTIRW
jgi:hypothetical protein